jgi:hypothetical protein
MLGLEELISKGLKCGCVKQELPKRPINHKPFLVFPAHDVIPFRFEKDPQLVGEEKKKRKF